MCRYLLCFICLWTLSLSAQKSTWEIQASAHAGMVIRHTSKINIGAGRLIPGGEIGLFRNTSGAESWHRYYHKPQIGASVIWFWPGTRTHGHAFGLCPGLVIPFKNHLEKCWIFRLSCGLGYVTNPYHFRDNPRQNAIGTHLNSAIQLRFSHRNLEKKKPYQLGFAFTHFSNGGIAQPNFGINMLSGFASIALGSKQKLDVIDQPALHESLPLIRRKIGVALHTHYSRIEYHIVQDGPKYPVYGLSLAAYYRMHAFNRFFFGAEIERNQAIYAWFIHATGGADEQKVRKGSDRRALFLANEFRFAQFGIYIQTSRYIGARFNHWALGNGYNKLSFRYYPAVTKWTGLQPVLGVQMKAHKTAAEFIGVSAGLEF